MELIATIVGLLLILTLVSAVLREYSVPYPTVMVIIGGALAFMPGLPKVSLLPEVIFLVFLPPLLYSHAWYMPWRDFMSDLLPILMLAVLLVVATMAGVAAVVHVAIPGVNWSTAFVVGAVLAPTDSIAVSSIAHRLGLPRRLTVLLEGEGLINDAAAIVAYRMTVAIVMSGSLSFEHLSEAAAFSTVGGLAIGLVAGLLSAQAHKLTRDARLETVVTILTPFVAYLPAEAFHFSGVLAVVTAGLFIGYRQSYLFTADTRLQSIAVWDVITFLLNGLIFILVGLQLPTVLAGVSEYGAGQLFLYALATYVAVLLTRAVWLYIIVGIEKAVGTQAPLSLGQATVAAWSGMRGGVSLAAALALPLALPNGNAFPNRDLLIFLVFSVLFATLVIQGLSLPFVIKVSKVCLVHHSEHLIGHARQRIAKAVLKELKENFEGSLETLHLIALEYDDHVPCERVANSATSEQRRKRGEREAAMRLALKIEREALNEMRKHGDTDEEVLREITRETDLREARLAHQARAPYLSNLP